ncbi:MAG TPA: flagellar protein FlaG [Steroidobacteraceae bacterium]|nr:flagellar protein FlaG [Steroidobacteraceae bacterium]
MAEDEISATGQFASLNSAGFATSYQTPDSSASHKADASPTEKAATASGVVPGAAPTTHEIHAAVAAANANLSSSNRQLDYRVDAATGISIAMIRNSQTGVVLQQIPGADIIALARLLAEWSPGKHMLLDLIA